MCKYHNLMSWLQCHWSWYLLKSSTVSPYIDIVLLFLHFLILWSCWMQRPDRSIPFKSVFGERDECSIFQYLSWTHSITNRVGSFPTYLFLCISKYSYLQHMFDKSILTFLFHYNTLDSLLLIMVTCILFLNSICAIDIIAMEINAFGKAKTIALANHGPSRNTVCISINSICFIDIIASHMNKIPHVL